MGGVSVGLVQARDNKTDLKNGYLSGSGTGGDQDYTVPSGKYWFVKHIEAGRSASGDISIYFLFDGVNVHRWEKVPSTTTVIRDLPGVKVQAGGILRVTFGTGSSGTFSSNVYYEEYDV